MCLFNLRAGYYVWVLPNFPFLGGCSKTVKSCPNPWVCNPDVL